jgi:hypothetical protein
MSRPAPAPLERVRALFEWWSARQPFASAAFDETRAWVLERLADDRERYSDVFEPSFSWDERGVFFRRFSYAFPGFRAAPDETARAAQAFFDPWGAAARDAGARLVRAARRDPVAQPIVGVADDRDRGVRVKLYLQFHERATEPAAELVRAMTGAALDTKRLNGALHMLGLDLSTGGVAGAKLYVARGAELDVHRIDDPADDFFARAPELDFAADHPRAAALADHYPEAFAAFDELRAAFAVRVRRASVETAGARKLTLYYAVD